MKVIAVGFGEASSRLLTALMAVSEAVTFVDHAEMVLSLLDPSEETGSMQLVLVDATDPSRIDHASATFAATGVRWCGVQDRYRVDFAARGLAHGALAMLRLDTPNGSFAEELLRIYNGRSFRTGSIVKAERTVSFRVGERVTVPPDHIGIVRSGVLIVGGSDTEGRPFVLGFIGPGEALLGAGEGAFIDIDQTGHASGCFELVDCRMVARLPAALNAQRARIRSLQTWARIRAEALVEDRVEMALAALGSVAGRPHALGTVIEVALTHAELAAAVGATRSTVTRV
ncbi:MAG: hypothetical protein CVV17_00525, partial [Gammaproteobacteria bacterium HGW-Gammaproteobacteria-7]